MASPFSVSDVLSLLAGLDNWIEAAASSSQPYDETRIQEDIPRWIRQFEKTLKTRITPVTIVQGDDNTIAAEPGTERVVETAHTFYSSLSGEYMATTLNNRPVIKILRVRVILSPSQNIFQVPSEWIRFDHRLGKFWAVPSGNGVAIFNNFISQVIIGSAIGSRDYLPQGLAIDYVAGLDTGWETTLEYADLYDATKKYCARQVLNRISHSLGTGRQNESISADGLSQNWTYSRFTDLKTELDMEIATFVDEWKDQHTPVLLEWL